MTDTRITHRKATDYTPDPRNANAGTERGQYMIDQSVADTGLGRSVVAAADGTIAAGNKTLQAAIDAGIVDVVEVETDGKTLVVVKRADWDGIEHEQARKYAYYDNRASEVGLAWDAERLLEDIGAGVDLSAMFHDDELDALLGELDGYGRSEAGDDPGADIDRADELRDKWQTERGQVWTVPSATVAGRSHRVMCGDSTSEADVARLMNGEKAEMLFTDPPYGVDYRGGHFHSGDVNIKREREALIGDTASIYVEFLPIVPAFVDGPCYVWFAGSRGLDVYTALSSNFEIHALIIWHKINAKYAAMNAQYKQRHEPCIYFKPKKSTLRWAGASTENTLWEIKRDPVNDKHPTQKPVALAVRALKNHDAKLVLDLFLGSGTTMVAAEQNERVCFAMELEPKYVAVTLERLAGMGLAPTLENGHIG